MKILEIFVGEGGKKVWVSVRENVWEFSCNW